MPKLVHHPELIDALPEPTPAQPWRVLISGCMAGWPCGVDGSDYGMGTALSGFAALPNVELIPFCPEDVGLGTPRSMPDIHGGDGFAVLDGHARVLDEHGVDLTEGMLTGARAMLAAERSALKTLQHLSGIATLTRQYVDAIAGTRRKFEHRSDASSLARRVSLAIAVFRHGRSRNA